MDLFVVNRYLGDDDSENKDHDEKTKISILLSKIEERKKKRKAENQSPNDEVISDVEDKQVNADKNVILSPEDHADVTVSKRKRKKKKKLDHSNDELGKEIEKDQDKTEGTNSKTVEGYTIIGSVKKNNKEKVEWLLPNWLANPSVISTDLQHPNTKVEDLSCLDKDLREILLRNSITHFFPVQAEVIPWVLDALNKPRRYWPQDVCVCAPTGSGKTLAFVLPIVQAIRHRMVVQLRALVVLPVQDLAAQVYEVFRTYTRHTDLRVALITGQTSFQAEQKQLVTCGIVSGYSSLVDIVVTTPGRLVDHLKLTPGFSLKHLRFLVIDEADRAIHNIQHDWLYHVYTHISGDNRAGYHAPTLSISTLESALTPPPQKLLFSATLTQDPEKLQQLGLFQPKLFTSVVGESDKGTEGMKSSRGQFLGKYTTPVELNENTCIVTPESKPLVLYHLFTRNKWSHVLVFVDSKKDAHRLSLLMNHLGQGTLKVAEISSVLSRPVRTKILRNFAAGNLDMIVCTDQFARGMDIENVNVVVLYNAPKSVKNYIHRVGRTGRAGRQGTSVTLLLEYQVGRFNEMLHAAGKGSVQDILVQESDLESLSELYKDSLEKLRSDLQTEAELELKEKKQKKRMTKFRKHRKLGNIMDDEKTSSR